jgi:hypothetical protein
MLRPLHDQGKLSEYLLDGKLDDEGEAYPSLGIKS